MSETVIKTSGLTKYYGIQPVVDHLDIEIPRGCICGFLGRNGAGKTTTIKMLLGLINPTAGSAKVLDCDSAQLRPDIRQRIGYVTEGHRLFRWMSIKRLEQFQRAFFPKQWDSQFFYEMIEYFELSPKKKIKHLSNGQRAQVSLALALTLAPRPELLIMDDPTLGLDAAIRRQFLEGMINLIMQEGRTVLFSSHILGDVERVCDRLLVLFNLGGLLTYLALHHSSLLRCQTCGKKRTVIQPSCVHCGHGLPRPQPKHTILIPA
ncbi:ABC transporter ATP-binding protein [Planctomycetota bacterium]